MPAQSLPPFIIITVGVAGMGALQYGVGLIFKPTKVPHDAPPPVLWTSARKAFIMLVLPNPFYSK